MTTFKLYYVDKDCRPAMSAFTVSRCVNGTLAASKATQTARLNGCGGSTA